MHELSDDDALWIGQGVPLMDSRNAEIIALVRAGYRAAQAAMPPLSAFGDILGHNYWMDATSLMKLWRRMQDAAQKEQTGGGVDGHAAIFGECARAERQTPIANPIAGIKPGPPSRRPRDETPRLYPFPPGPPVTHRAIYPAEPLQFSIDDDGDLQVVGKMTGTAYLLIPKLDAADLLAFARAAAPIIEGSAP